MFSFLFKGIAYTQKFEHNLRKGKRRGLHRVAGLIRVTAIRSIRVSPNPSAPGTPPHARKRGGLRDIKFDVYQNGAIIGPIKYSRSNFFNQPVPHIHEFGGTYMGLFGYARYPQRSYMNYSLQQLHRRGLLPREFNVGMGVMFNN